MATMPGGSVAVFDRDPHRSRGEVVDEVEPAGAGGDGAVDDVVGSAEHAVETRPRDGHVDAGDAGLAGVLECRCR